MSSTMTIPENACIETIKQLIETYQDWKLALEKRQHKFVHSLKKHTYDSPKVAADFHYSHVEILSIFSRIEQKLVQWDAYKKEKQKQAVLQKKEAKRQLELKRKEEERVKELNEQAAVQKWRLQMEEEARQLEQQQKKEEAVQNNIRKVLTEIENAKSKDLVEKVLQQSAAIDVYKVYPFKLAQYIDSILQLNSVEKTAEALSVSKTYIIQRICGRKKPRKPCERGAVHYLDIAKQQNKKAMEN